MTRQDENGNTIITLDVPQREGKEGYVGTVYGLYLRLGAIVADANFKESDTRAYFMMKILIGLVPGKNNRKIIREAMQKELDEKLKDVHDIGERNKIRNEVCLDHLGDINDFVDKHVGVSDENRLGIVAPPIVKEKK